MNSVSLQFDFNILFLLSYTVTLVYGQLEVRFSVRALFRKRDLKQNTSASVVFRLLWFNSPDSFVQSHICVDTCLSVSLSKTNIQMTRYLRYLRYLRGPMKNWITIWGRMMESSASRRNKETQFHRVRTKLTHFQKKASIHFCNASPQKKPGT